MYYLSVGTALTDGRPRAAAANWRAETGPSAVDNFRTDWEVSAMLVE